MLTNRETLDNELAALNEDEDIINTRGRTLSPLVIKKHKNYDNLGGSVKYISAWPTPTTEKEIEDADFSNPALNFRSQAISPMPIGILKKITEEDIE